jgi:hypothetical protein
MQRKRVTPSSLADFTADEANGVFACLDYLYAEAMAHALYLPAHMIGIAAEAVKEEFRQELPAELFDELTRKLVNLPPAYPAPRACDDPPLALAASLEDLCQVLFNMHLPFAAHFAGAAAEAVKAAVERSGHG